MAATDDPYASLTTTNVAAPPAPAPAAQATAAQADTTQATAAQAGPIKEATAEGYTAAQTGDTNTATASTRDVQSNETVQGQLAGIIDSNSPLLQRARSKALDQMNARGLVNSSMAIGAADAAMYDVALPIAQFDAGVYGQAARDNQAALTQVSMFNAEEKNKTDKFNVEQTNAASQFNTGEKNKVSVINATEANKLEQFNTGEVNRVAISNTEIANANARQNASLITQANLQNASEINKVQADAYDAAVKMAVANADAENKAILVKLDGVVKTQITQLEAQYKNQIQSSATASTVYQSAMQQMTAIMANPDIPASAKPAYVSNILNMARAGMDTAGALSSTDLSQYLDGIEVTYGLPAPNPVDANGQPISNTPAPAPAPAPAQPWLGTGSGYQDTNPG